MKKLLIIMSLILVSCGSEEIVKCDNSPEWNIDPLLENDFWGAMNMLEAQGTNLTKFKTEDLEVVFVDKIDSDSDKTIAQAQNIFGDGIRIVVLKDKYTHSEYVDQQSLENKMTMLHEIGHDYFNLKHHEGEWDIMNSINTLDKVVTEEDLINSINRMLMEGRVIYDSLAKAERF